MVYESPINLSQDNPDINLSAAAAPTDKVYVYYNGTGLHSIAGPVPMVDFGKTYNRTEGGLLQSTTTRININGKIIRTQNTDSSITPHGSGTSILLNAAQQMHDLFKCDNGVFEIKCGSSPILSYSGVKILNFSSNKTSDNWIFSTDYTVDLEYYEPAIANDNNYKIKKGSDSWSLEPIEDAIYADFGVGVKSQAEYHNPLLKPSAPSDTTAVGTDNILQIKNIPQFKLSRKVAAEGIPDSTGTSCGTANNYSAYLNAEKWVKTKLAEAFSNSTSGLPKFSSNTLSSLSNFQNLFLYNHLRTISFDHLGGSYEVNDTWIAMPTGIRYIEDYTIESSTDERYVKTVRVQGSIRGLMVASIPIMSGASGLTPNDSGVIALNDYSVAGLSGSVNTPDMNITSVGASQAFYGNKYSNAASGWLNDIKPYLYRRASLATNSNDRNKNYIQSNVTPAPLPGNPTYSFERLLNIIPVSTSETHDPRKGNISYSYEYTNKFKLISGVIAENITINDTGPVNVINQAFVLGRKLGPVLQDLGARTSATKTVVVDIIVPPPSSADGCLVISSQCPVWTGGTTYQTISKIIEGLKPFGTRASEIFPNMARGADSGQVYVSQDDQSWQPTEGRFSRTVTWIYQSCNLSRYYLDT